MKTHKSLSTLLVVAFALAPQLLNTSTGALAASGGTYSAKLFHRGLDRFSTLGNGSGSSGPPHSLI
jgi:hypothetical protein